MALAIIAVIYVSGCVQQQEQQQTTTSTVPTTTTVEITTTTMGEATTTTTAQIITTLPQPQTHNIEIKNFAYSSSELQIKKGDTVIWTNKDSTQHTVTSDSGNELASGLLSQGQTYSHTFDEQGTFDYHCIPHPYMKGKVIVE